MGHCPVASLSVMGAQHWWTEAAFAACLAWHWPDHNPQYNWVAWVSSCMCAGKTRTLQATTVTISSHVTRDVSVFFSNETWFLDFFCKLPQIRTSNFRKVMQQHTGGMVGCIIWVLLQIYFSFQQWKNFENPLRINKVIAMSLVYYFLGDKVCIYRRLSPAISLSNSNSNTIKIAENYSMQL